MSNGASPVYLDTWWEKELFDGAGVAVWALGAIELAVFVYLLKRRERNGVMWTTGEKETVRPFIMLLLKVPQLLMTVLVDPERTVRLLLIVVSLVAWALA
mmetsp:Transcript_1526/g.4631  ORF Transcript_1526/g.4631 Transcript_1526/m.4631 type:complete len:100 (-) Transcript_1526:1450-1749(-)